MPPIAPGGIVSGRFLVERVIGSGGSGVVVAARHITLNKRVALKFLRSDALSDEDALRRFVLEARATAVLTSEHVARVMDAETIHSSLAFIAMEFLQGRDLAQIVEANGPLPMDDAVHFILQACEAVAEAHARNIVHRDIKPSNLFLTRAPDGSPFIKVLDFGISKVGRAGPSVTSENRVLGTPHFMSPEQMRSSRDADSRSDIWSLGAVLFTLLAGRCPFQGDYLTEVCAAVLCSEIEPLREIRPEIPVALEMVILRCLALEPEDRFQTATELAVALRPFAPAQAADCVGRVIRIAQAAEAAEAAPVSSPPHIAIPPASIPQRASLGGAGLGATDITFGLVAPTVEKSVGPETAYRNKRRYRATFLVGGALLIISAAGVAVAVAGWGRSPSLMTPGRTAASALLELAPAGSSATFIGSDARSARPPSSDLAASAPASAASLATAGVAGRKVAPAVLGLAARSKAPASSKLPSPAGSLRPSPVDLFSDAK